MANINFMFSFTTQSGQRKRMKTDKPLEVMGQIIKDQYVQAAKVETSKVMGSSIASATFSSLRDVLQSAAIVFQRIVARTPIDESYEFKFEKTIGENGQKLKKPEIEDIQHKPDNDVLRNDWILNLKIDDCVISVKATDYDSKLFEKVNDKSSIQAILNDLVNRLSSMKKVSISGTKVTSSVSINFENKNGHFAQIEYGYRKKDSNHGVVEGEERKHGIVNGFSVQAPSGFFRISMIELGQILSIHGSSKVSTRLKKVCYSFAHKNKFFLKKMGNINLTSNSQLNSFMNEYGPDWQTNFNDLWRAAVKSTYLKSVLEEIDEERMRIKAMPDVFVDTLGEEKMRASLVEDMEEELRQLDDSPLNKIRKTYLEGRLKDLRKGAKISELDRSLYESTHATRNARDFMTEDEKALFISAYAKKLTFRDGEYGKIMNLAIEGYINDKKFAVDPELEIMKKGLQIMKKKHPDFMERYEWDENFRAAKMDKVKAQVKIYGERYYELHPERFPVQSNHNYDPDKDVLLLEMRDLVKENSYLFNRHRTKTDVNQREGNIRQMVRDVFYNKHMNYIKEQNKKMAIIDSQIHSKSDLLLMLTSNEYKRRRSVQLRTFYVGEKKVLGLAAYKTMINEKIQEEQKAIIAGFNEDIRKLYHKRNAIDGRIAKLKRKEMPEIEKALKASGYGGNKKQGSRNSGYWYGESKETRYRDNGYGKQVPDYQVSKEMQQFKTDLLIKYNKQKASIQKSLDRLLKEFSESLSSTRKKPRRKR